MANTALVTGADRGLGLALCAGLLERGWDVYAGQYMPDWPELEALADRSAGRLMTVPLDVSSLDSVRAAAEMVAEKTGQLDLLVNNAGINPREMQRSIKEGLHYEGMHLVYDINALGPLRVVEAFLPLVARSTFKRLCFVSSEAGSIDRCRRTSGYGYNMSKSALNMAVKVLFNDLRPEGFTFRVYHPGWVRSYIGGKGKNTQASLEPEEAARPALDFFLSGQAGAEPVYDEDRLVMRDYIGQEWPW